MEAAAAAKGSVTSLASLFPAEEAQRAARRVEDVIAEKQKELDRLHHFISENNNVVKLAKKLPEQLSHTVMVPFGKAAFFPGRLIHTNEILVLLGEGYYAERTSKQTVDILQRRGKLLDSQVESFKAVMSDLKAEASFFKSTAAEADEGIVEIRENYDEELESERMSNLADSSRSGFLGSGEVTDMKPAAADVEHARMMAKFDELEMEELAAESVNDGDKDVKDKIVKTDMKTADDEEYARMMAKLDELEREELAAEGANDGDEDVGDTSDNGCSISQDYFDKSLSISEFGDLKDQYISKGVSLQEKQYVGKFDITEKALSHPEYREKSSGVTQKAGTDSEKAPISTRTTSDPPSRMRADSSRAFTGSIVEHSYGLKTNPSSQISTASQATGSVPSKPLSRFKMQKGGH